MMNRAGRFVVGGVGELGGSESVSRWSARHDGREEVKNTSGHNWVTLFLTPADRVPAPVEF